MTFLIVAVVVTLAACGQAIATRDEETEGRLEALLVQPVARLRWLAGRARSPPRCFSPSGGHRDGDLDRSGGRRRRHRPGHPPRRRAQCRPAGLFVLGVGALAYGLIPRLAGGIVYGLVVWSFTVELVGAGLPARRWLRNLSVLHHISRAPAQDPCWAMASVLVGVGVTAAALGMAAFARRDLQAA